MPRCEVCGNDYDKVLHIRRDGVSHFYDCFECAIHALAPVCEHCGCRIIGHGVEISSHIFCGANCAEQAGVHGFTDRVIEVVAKA